MSGFSRFAKGATAPTPATPVPAAAAPAPAPAVVVEPEVITPATVQAPPAAPAVGGFRGLAPLKANVLAAIAARADETPTFTEPFPHITLKGGNAGGQVVPTKSTEANFRDLANQLPQGKQPVFGVLMAVRAEAIAWPSGQDDDAPAATPGAAAEKARPVINCALSLADTDGITALVAGSENFQFASREIKAAKWATAAGGPGHLRPVFQMLVWLPSVGECIVVQLAPLLKTFQEMAKQLQKVMDSTTGELRPVPVKLSPTTAPWYDTNVFHYFALDVAADAKGKEAYTAYTAWLADVQANRPDMVAGITDWYNGDDKPASDADVEKLTRAANMVNARRGRGAAS